MSEIERLMREIKRSMDRALVVVTLSFDGKIWAASVQGWHERLMDSGAHCAHTPEDALLFLKDEVDRIQRPVRRESQPEKGSVGQVVDALFQFVTEFIDNTFVTSPEDIAEFKREWSNIIQRMKDALRR